MVAVSEKSVRVRFAPSPTGPLHVGGVRTALFNWLFARQNNGKFILRVEDTDKERSTKEYEHELIEGLLWLGLEWDEGPSYGADKRGLSAQMNADKISDNPRRNQRTSAYFGDYGPYRQSERTEIYKKYLEKLLAEGRAYYCYCTKEELEAERQAMLAQGLPPKYSSHCRNLLKPPEGKEPQIIRFKTPEAQVEFKDMIRGKVSFNATLFGDLVIAKDLKTPLYNLAAVVDDHEMKISHVIRGEEHLSNTPKQILLQKALGFGEPEYAHLPLILNPDRSKMSKRFADTALSEYRKQGYLPEAIVNFLALLGWHPKDEQEIFVLTELAKVFDLRRVQKGGAVFNLEKLNWLQKEHLKKLTTAEIADDIEPALRERQIKYSKEFLKKVVDIERARLTTLNEFFALAGFFFKLPDYETKLLSWNNEPLAKIEPVLAEVLKIVGTLKDVSPSRETLIATLSALIEKEGRGVVLWPLRVALSGQAASPDPFEIIGVLGKNESMDRIKTAIEKISGNKNNGRN